MNDRAESLSQCISHLHCIVLPDLDEAGGVFWAPVRPLVKLSSDDLARCGQYTWHMVNPYKLIIHTKAPSIIIPHYTKAPSIIIPHYLSQALSAEGMVMPKALVDEKMKDQVARHPIGSGPYRFVEQVTGSHIKFEAVPNHQCSS
jgi:hypothetical protein